MSFDNSIEIYNALGLLTPYNIDIDKVRIGPDRDGGYVLANSLDPRQPVISYGISTEYEFDRTMAERGHDVYMFDHTITGIDDPHPRMKLFLEGLAGRYRHDEELGFLGESEPEHSLFSIADHLRRCDIVGDSLLLKMDVEGAEWAALAYADDETLSRFDQIVIELHGLGDLGGELYRKVFVRALEKLNRQFTLFHVHANNVDGPDNYFFVGGMPVSCLLEASFVRTSLVNRKPSTIMFPTGIDFPNMHDRDRLLWMYPFLPDKPSKEAAAASLASANRLNKGNASEG